MASEPTVGEGDGAREKQRYTENKVYTRKAFKGLKKKNINNTANTKTDTVTPTTTALAAPSATPTTTALAAPSDTPNTTALATPSATPTTPDDNNITKNDDNITVNEKTINVKDNNVKENDNSIKENESSIKENDNSIKENDNSIKENDNSIKENDNNKTNNDKDEILTHAPAQTIPLEDENSAQQQLRSEGGHSAQQQLRSEGGHSAQQQLRSEDGNSAQQQLRSEDGNSDQQQKLRSEDANSAQQQQQLPSEDGNSAQQQQPPSEDGNSAQQQQPPSEDGNSAQRQEPVLPLAAAASGDSSSPNRREQAVSVVEPEIRDPPAVNGVPKEGSDSRIKINLASRSKQEMRELRRKLESELDMVRGLVKKIEVKQGQIGVFKHSNVSLTERRVHSEVSSVGIPREATRPLHQLSISVLENSQGMSDIVEKEKRTPKANQFYHNSEFLLAKDKFPPAESNKKSKLNGKKHGGGDLGQGYGMGGKFFKSCSSLLEKLMKHKHSWVFNEPVDAAKLGLHDYHIIIKHPMDLGTIKSRLNKNWYKSPKEFAEDVRLTFYNAMTYNPAGQDVHVMAEQLSRIFEDRWAIIESDYNREIRFGYDYGASLPTPTSRKAPPLPPPPLDMRRILDRSESISHHVDPKPKPIAITPRTPAPKKPKAKDPHKRDMTYEEKQKLSTNLQSLPSEKLDAIVQIIKRRNSSLMQHDDEIEVDIDSVDAETLWELDRFVTNYKKSLSKHKRKAEMAMQARAEAEENVQQQNQAPIVAEVPKETKTDDKIVSSSTPIQGDNQGDNRSRSSSSSSSSSDSGSSSSDSDSDSSSASGSDAGSPRT